MNRLGNLYEDHLKNGCEKKQPGADMRLSSFRAEVTTLLANLESLNMRRRLHMKREEAKKNSHNLTHIKETERDNINQQKWVN
jgi:hypothetical protein